MKIVVTYVSSKQITEDQFVKITHCKVYNNMMLNDIIADFVKLFGLGKEGHVLSGIEIKVCED